MSDIQELIDKKNIVRDALRRGEIPGVVGVGVDRLAEILRVFHYQNKETRAKKSILNLLGPSFADRVGFQPFRQRTLKAKRVRRGFLRTRQDVVAPEAVTLQPADQIAPAKGQEGRLGCFVAVSQGTVAALTVEHIFHEKGTKQGVSVRTCPDDLPQCLTGVGVTREAFSRLQGGIGIVNNADCTLFFPNGYVVLKPGEHKNKGFVSAGDIEKTNLLTVKGLTGHLGQVLDADSAIKYSVFLADGKQHEVLLDQQILIQSDDLGSEGDSGMLVVLDEQDVSKTFAVGDALGLYIAIIDTGEFHFVTPLHACLTAVGAKEVHIPP